MSLVLGIMFLHLFCCIINRYIAISSISKSVPLWNPLELFPSNREVHEIAWKCLNIKFHSIFPISFWVTAAGIDSRADWWKISIFFSFDKLMQGSLQQKFSGDVLQFSCCGLPRVIKNYTYLLKTSTAVYYIYIISHWKKFEIAKEFDRSVLFLFGLVHQMEFKSFHAQQRK